MARNFSLSIMAVLLAGCSLAPTPKRPDITIPDNYRYEAQQSALKWKLAAPKDGQKQGAWWQIFDDPLLNDLQLQAEKNNPSVQIAAARLVQARTLVRTARADQLPSVDGSAGVSRRSSSTAQTGTTRFTGNVYDIQATASYEIDLFNRLSDATAAARLDAAAQEALYQQALLTLHSDIANYFFSIRTLSAQEKLLAEAVKLRQEAERITQRRLDNGDASALDVTQAQAERAQTEADLFDTQRQKAVLINALAVTLGQTPAALTLALAPLKGEPPEVPAGLPSELLERRPDIAAAQRTMMAANQRIGIARAAAYPVLNLTASGGVSSPDLEDVLKWSNRTWAIGPMLALPLFTGGRVQAAIDRSRAVYDESIATYRQQVLVAFQEVEDALVSFDMLKKQETALNEALAAATKAERIARLRYDEGEARYTDWLDAQRTRLTAERSYVTVKGNRFNQTIALMRALGGAWYDRIEEKTPAAMPVAAPKKSHVNTPEKKSRKAEKTILERFQEPATTSPAQTQKVERQKVMTNKPVITDKATQPAIKPQPAKTPKPLTASKPMMPDNKQQQSEQIGNLLWD